jgi:membrane protein required for colicin V production
LTGLDYFVIFIALLSGAAGWRRGLLRSAVTVGAALLGLVLAANLYGQAGAMLAILTTTRRAADLLGFGAIFVTTLAAGAYGGYRLRTALERRRLSWVDRGLGASAGLARAWLVSAALYMALTAFPVRIDAVERSRLAPVLVEGTRVLAYLGSREFRQRFAEGYAWLQGERESDRDREGT